jgi:hypothetical protein
MFSKAEIQRVEAERAAADANQRAFMTQPRIRFYRDDHGVVRLSAKLPNGDNFDRPATQADLEDRTLAAEVAAFRSADADRP